jgi:hypothetical protein
MKPSLQRLIAVALAAQLVLTPPSQAAVIADAQPLERTELRAKLEARGVSDAESLARVEALTESEARALAAHIDTLPAGGEPISGMLTLALIIVAIPILLVGAAMKALFGSK